MSAVLCCAVPRCAGAEAAQSCRRGGGSAGSGHGGALSGGLPRSGGALSRRAEARDKVIRKTLKLRSHPNL